MIRDREVFMTGGFGFIGSALLARFLPENRVTVFDNGRRRSPVFEQLAGHANLTVIEGDVMDHGAVEAAIGTPDVIIHLAAVAGVSSYYRTPLLTMDVNLIGSRNVLEASLKSRGNLQRFLFFSTSEVYGPHAHRVREDGPTTQGDVSDRRWTYAISKLAAEKLALCQYWEHDLPVVSIRPFNVYGPGQVGEGAIQRFVARALRGEPLEVTGDGKQVRSWCYIEDLLSAVEVALTSEKAVGRVYNVGNPDATLTILELAERVRQLVGSNSPINLVPHQGTDIRDRVPDISHVQDELGYMPRIGMDEGLRRTIAWHRLTHASNLWSGSPDA